MAPTFDPVAFAKPFNEMASAKLSLAGAAPVETGVAAPQSQAAPIMAFNHCLTQRNQGMSHP